MNTLKILEQLPPKGVKREQAILELGKDEANGELLFQLVNTEKGKCKTADKKDKKMNAKNKMTSGADQTTPSVPQYFSWLNNTNEGATQAQTLLNLAYFKWLKEE